MAKVNLQKGTYMQASRRHCIASGGLRCKTKLKTQPLREAQSGVQGLSPCLMVEQAETRKGHRDAVLVAGFDDHIVTD